MKFLFDENLRPKLVRLLAAEYPDSSHIEALGMRGASDRSVWTFAGTHGYTIVSKDNDFRQRVFLEGAPPKVIWLSVGNAGTHEIAELIRGRFQQIQAFHSNDDDGLLVLELFH